MEEIINFEHLNSLLKTIAEDLATQYKNNLSSSGKGNSKLYQQVRPVVDTDNHTAGLDLPDYYIFVEKGRRPGKFPPPPAIEKFVEEKFPREANIPREKQSLTYLISRKIAKEGIKPGNQLEEAVKVISAKYEKLLEEAIAKDIETFLAEE